MDDKGEKVYDPDIMKKRLMGLISYYELNKKCNPDVLFEKERCEHEFISKHVL